jgi:hypothetical protein
MRLSVLPNAGASLTQQASQCVEQRKEQLDSTSIKILIAPALKF